MRAMVDNLDLSFAKKGRLFNRINALQQEIDRDRTRYEMLAGLVVDGSDNLAQVADRWLPTLQAIVNVFRTSKETEDEQRARLPTPKQPKRIEPPKRSDPSF